MNEKKISVILDTDIGYDIDDIWALGFLLKCPELDVKLITTVSQNTHIKTKLVAKFLELADCSNIPIGIGPKESRSKGMLFNWVKDYNLSNYPGVIYNNGIESICKTIIKCSEPVTLIAIGPLGNIARAIKFNPEITQSARFVGMQGSLRIGYAGNPTSSIEYNVSYNIEACREVFKAPWEKTITPLDTCGNIVLSDVNFERFMSSEKTIPTIIKENFKIWAKKRNLMNLITKEKETSILFDTVAIYLAFSEDLLNIENLKIEITDRGLTNISEKGSMIRCATSWKDEYAFKTFLVDRLID